MAGTDEATRTLSDYLAIIRRRLLLIVLVGLVTITAAAVYTFRQPTVYRAVMKLVVGQKGGVFDPRLGNVAEQFTQTMSDLLQSDVVARSTIADLRLTGINPRELLSELHVLTKPETAVLVVTYDDTNRARGVQILDRVGKVFTRLVSERLVTQEDAEFAVSVSVFDNAHPVPDPVQPTPVRNLGVAFVLGILLGLLAAVVREQFDDTIRGVEVAEKAFGQTATTTLPPGVVGYRPFDRSATRRLDPVITELALQKLRAGILWTPEATEARTLLVTSANPEEGKTTIASNLAVVMVTEGRNVIVIDGDLRHPVLYRYLGMPVPTDRGGLDAVIRGEVAVRDALVDIPVPARTFAAVGEDGRSWSALRHEAPAPGRLRAILAPPGAGRPTELTLARTLDLMQELRSHADIVIFDSPPLLVVPDAYPLVATVDTIIAVVRIGKTTAKAASHLSRTLERLRARRIELVVADAEPSFAQTYYYGYASGPSARDRARGRDTTPTRPPVPGVLGQASGDPRR